MSDEKEAETRDGAGETAGVRGWRLVNSDALKNPPVALAASVYLVATLFALAVLVLVGFGLFAAFQIAYETAIGKFADRIEAAKVFFPILLALVGGPLLIWRVITAHIQAQATRHQADTGREAHYTSLFTKAVEQLGATREVKETVEIDDAHGVLSREIITKTEPNLEVRLGAIYALERIAQDSGRDFWSIMEVLCAYVRSPQNCGVPPKRSDQLVIGSPDYMKWLASLKPHVDIQAALYAIGRRHVRQAMGDRRLDFTRIALQDITLWGLNFERANFRRAYLEGVTFNKAILTTAIYIEAKLDVVFFDNADLQGAFFSESKINSGFFDDTNLRNAWFNQAKLSKVYFRRATLTSVVFDGANYFEGAFSQSDLTGASLQGVSLYNVDFTDANLSGASVFNTDFSHVQGLTSEQLAAALGDASTKLPESLVRPAGWPDRKLSWPEREKLMIDVRKSNA